MFKVKVFFKKKVRKFNNNNKKIKIKINFSLIHQILQFPLPLIQVLNL